MCSSSYSSTPMWTFRKTLSIVRTLNASCLSLITNLTVIHIFKLIINHKGGPCLHILEYLTQRLLCVSLFWRRTLQPAAFWLSRGVFCTSQCFFRIQLTTLSSRGVAAALWCRLSVNGSGGLKKKTALQNHECLCLPASATSL